VKLSVAIQTSEIKTQIPVALLSGSFFERLQKAAEYGYDGVELMVAVPHELDVEEILNQLKKLGLRVSAVGSGAVYMVDKYTLLAEDPEISRQAATRLSDLIQFAASLEAPLVTIGGFRGRAAWAGRDARLKLIEILRSAADQASREGVRLVLEPLNRYESDIINNATEGLSLLEEIGHSHIGLLLDTFHVNIEEPSFHSSIRQVMAAGRLWHIHIGDSNRLPPGRGHIDFSGIVTTLREIGYDGYLSAELLPLPDPDKAAEETIQCMRRLIPNRVNDKE